MAMKALALVSVVCVSACAMVGPADPAPSRAELSRADIERSTYANALDLVTAERPHWLRTRGRTSFTNEPAIGVYVDGVRAGGPEFLAQLSPIDIESIRYYDGREAQFRFGIGHTHGALDVIMRR
jgi:hypothetical protein